jgi:glucosamine kinase
MVLCIDAGATSSKWTVKDLGGNFISGKVTPLTGHIFDEEGYRNARKIFEDIKVGIGTTESCDEVVIGITGLDKDSLISQEITKVISEVYEIDSSHIRLMSDIELAFEAVLDLGEGILIYAGTGAIAVSIDAMGTFHRAGGWGFHNGDDGGGYSIGRNALRHVTQLWDIGADPLQDPLARAVLLKAGANNWSELRNYIYGGGRSAVGELAIAVMEQASIGSELALQILQDAGASLANLAISLRSRLGTNKFIAMGGAFRLHPVILEALSSGLGAPIQYVNVDISREWIVRHC